MTKADPPPRGPSTMPPRSRLSLAAVLLSALALLYLFKQYPSTLPFAPSPAPGPAKPPTRDPQPIPLEAHIMSMCPDARDCLESLVVPAMALLPASAVNFTLSFIGRPTASDGGVECPHGPRECLGDMLELCAARLYPHEPKRHLGFAMCLSRRYDEIPQRGLVEGCAARQGVAFERLNECASGEDGASGMDMLRRSVEWSAQQGVVKSCTVGCSAHAEIETDFLQVRVDNKIRCIRDGARWYDCPGGTDPEDLVKEIEALYKERNG